MIPIIRYAHLYSFRQMNRKILEWWAVHRSWVWSKELLYHPGYWSDLSPFAGIFFDKLVKDIHVDKEQRREWWVDCLHLLCIDHYYDMNKLVVRNKLLFLFFTHMNGDCCWLVGIGVISVSKTTRPVRLSFSVSYKYVNVYQR